MVCYFVFNYRAKTIFHPTHSIHTHTHTYNFQTGIKHPAVVFIALIACWRSFGKMVVRLSRTLYLYICFQLVSLGTILFIFSEFGFWFGDHEIRRGKLLSFFTSRITWLPWRVCIYTKMTEHAIYFILVCFHLTKSTLMNAQWRAIHTLDFMSLSSRSPSLKYIYIRVFVCLFCLGLCILATCYFFLWLPSILPSFFLRCAVFCSLVLFITVASMKRRKHEKWRKKTWNRLNSEIKPATSMCMQAMKGNWHGAQLSKKDNFTALLYNKRIP